MKKIIKVLQGESFDIPPIWLMRQAGRYLPEYKSIRSSYENFMEFCFTPNAITQVTLQPIRRFNFDAAIIFSDILIIPHIMGQKVNFKKNHGPILEDISWQRLINQCYTINLEETVSPIMQAISDTRYLLDSSKALIGFVGSPWTLATYIISQGKTENFKQIEPVIEQNYLLFLELIEALSQTVTQWLKLQIKAGCDVVQIFDSWAGMLPQKYHEEILFKPLKHIVNQLKESLPQTPIIYFGKGVSLSYPKLTKKIPNIALSIDHHSNLEWLNNHVNSQVPFQGNLCPIHLKNGNFEQLVNKQKKLLRKRSYIFNLGHGILTDTPIEHVEKLVQLVQCKNCPKE